MELSTSPLSYKGSISEAINEALTHKKLFVVFISGEDNSSKNLEQLTLADKRVVDAVQKYCIFLHLHAGTEDASQFAVIYPPKSVPCISVIGYNGAMTSQHDGFITADSFVGSIEKAWENMKLQETAAALFSAALAARNLESPKRGTLEAQEKGSSSTTVTPSASEDIPDNIIEEPDFTNPSINVTVEHDLSRVSSKVHEGETNSSECNSQVVNEISEGEKEAISSNPVQLTDVLLSIRLPNGSRLQLSSPLTDNLQSVKKYVIENDASNIGSFDLAIPYPRKLFTDQDMDQPLSELGFSSREALIVVPHMRADVVPRSPRVSFQSQDTHREDEDGGYFAFLKRIISFVNPFSYFGGASQASTPVQTTAFQGNQDPRFLRSYGSDEQNPTSGSNSSASRSRGPTTFGGNVHTLRDMEREDPSSDRNLFWNGNSTEFGGDGKK